LLCANPPSKRSNHPLFVPHPALLAAVVGEPMNYACDAEGNGPVSAASFRRKGSSVPALTSRIIASTYIPPAQTKAGV